ncbi:hypothetical protein GCN78_04650 [Janthinobacterium rivuli]|uniref:hypothetical protein n=1 Tax=Janthinobacterium sp. FT68W TaxID=2654255 RepID=UPI0012650A9D|nr:hypothetical protein [Janthinobacterium sp. FT68W]KAB8053872.1 hypothetical protein GCN78_04650 [Janthinobacterium sp. FT68W]
MLCVLAAACRGALAEPVRHYSTNKNLLQSIAIEHCNMEMLLFLSERYGYKRAKQAGLDAEAGLFMLQCNKKKSRKY